MVSAYFISPIGKLIICEKRHIERIVACPEDFNMTMEMLEKEYHAYSEEMPMEGCARAQVIANLLLEGWVRARIRGNGYLYCQVGIINKRIYKNILKLITHLKLVMTRKEFRRLGVRIYVEQDLWIIDGYDMKDSMKQIERKLK